WRRKWLILAVGIIVGAASYFYNKHKTHVFTTQTQVYLASAGEEVAPGEKAPAKSQASNGSDQAAIINSLGLEEVRTALRKRGERDLAKGGKVKARAPEKSPFITINVEGHTAKGVTLLANEVAQTYVKRQHANHRRAIEKAIALSRRQLRR